MISVTYNPSYHQMQHTGNKVSPPSGENDKQKPCHTTSHIVFDQYEIPTNLVMSTFGQRQLVFWVQII